MRSGLRTSIIAMNGDFGSEGLRARTLLSFAFTCGGHRRSKVAAADRRYLRRISDKSYIYRLKHSKTQQAGVTASSTMDKPVLHRAALALEDCLEAVGITEGGNFRRLWSTRLAPLTHRRSSMHRRARLPGWREILLQLTEHRAVPSAIGYFHSDDTKNNTAARPPES